jgi:hypothetical protein
MPPPPDDRLTRTAASQGLDAGSTARAAIGMLSKQIILQATVITFDAAFSLSRCCSSWRHRRRLSAR